MNPTSTLFFALALVIAAFSGGWVVRDWKAGAEMAEVLAQAAKDQAARRSQVDAAAAGHEKYRKAAAARERVVIKEVERVIEKPVYLNTCFDDAGLQLLAADIAAHRWLPVTKAGNRATKAAVERVDGLADTLPFLAILVVIKQHIKLPGIGRRQIALR